MRGGWVRGGSEGRGGGGLDEIWMTWSKRKTRLWGEVQGLEGKGKREIGWLEGWII